MIKIYCFFLIFIVIFLTSCSVSTLNKSISSQPDTENDYILVMIKKEYSDLGKEYTPADFNNGL